MRKYLAALSVAILTVAAIGGTALSQRAHANTESPGSATVRTIDVVGRGTVTVKPDTAVITFGVTSLADSPTDSYQEVGRTLTKVTNALIGVSLKEEELATSGLHMGAEYEWQEKGGQTLKGYRTTTTLTITTKQLESVAAIIETAVKAGANQLQGVRFMVKNTDALIEQATDLAADDATSKASRVATRMGSNVIRVMKINVMDHSTPNMPRPYAVEKSMASSDAIQVFSGESTVTVSISASFEIQ
jgi:uncharacterized protein YggE